MNTKPTESALPEKHAISLTEIIVRDYVGRLNHFQHVNTYSCPVCKKSRRYPVNFLRRKIVLCDGRQISASKAQ